MRGEISMKKILSFIVGSLLISKLYADYTPAQIDNRTFDPALNARAVKVVGPAVPITLGTATVNASINNTPWVYVINSTMSVVNFPSDYPNSDLAGKMYLCNTKDIVITSGTVNVGNFPDTIIVASGTISIDNFPSAVDITGSTITVNNIPFDYFKKGEVIGNTSFYALPSGIYNTTGSTITIANPQFAISNFPSDYSIKANQEIIQTQLNGIGYSGKMLSIDPFVFLSSGTYYARWSIPLITIQTINYKSFLVFEVDIHGRLLRTWAPTFSIVGADLIIEIGDDRLTKGSYVPNYQTSFVPALCSVWTFTDIKDKAISEINAKTNNKDVVITSGSISINNNPSIYNVTGSSIIINKILDTSNFPTLSIGSTTINVNTKDTVITSGTITITNPAFDVTGSSIYVLNQISDISIEGSTVVVQKIIDTSNFPSGGYENVFITSGSINANISGSISNTQFNVPAGTFTLTASQVADLKKVINSDLDGSTYNNIKGKTSVSGDISLSNALSWSLDFTSDTTTNELSFTDNYGSGTGYLRAGHTLTETLCRPTTGTFTISLTIPSGSTIYYLISGKR